MQEYDNVTRKDGDKFAMWLRGKLNNRFTDAKVPKN
jgi:hypothetical protein